MERERMGVLWWGEVGGECRRYRCIDFFPWPQHTNSAQQEIVSFPGTKCSLISASGYAVDIMVALNGKIY
jgi:hypothetical protein